jgi:hypothetical protein
MEVNQCLMRLVIIYQGQSYWHYTKDGSTVFEMIPREISENIVNKAKMMAGTVSKTARETHYKALGPLQAEWESQMSKALRF